MKKQYDFSKATKNPYAGMLKRPVTIRLDEESVAYFKEMANEIGIPYQTLINLYLRDCAASRRKLSLAWRSVSA
jgi:predicted DNA binding CopG/RHH family protein